ncbi:hypothetical protein Tco_1402963 [Tanacetum coccineum]
MRISYWSQKPAIALRHMFVVHIEHGLKDLAVLDYMIGKDCYLIPIVLFQDSWISGDGQKNQFDQNASYMASTPRFHQSIIRKPPAFDRSP